MTALEKEILSRIKLGDEKAFEYVFKSYYQSLCAYAHDLVKSDDQAEETVQEILIKFWEYRDQIEINTSLKSYLFRSVHNQCLNFLKHSQVVKNLSEKFTEETNQLIEFTLYSDSEFSLDYYFYEGLEQDVQDTIQSLPEQCRKIFQLSRFERLQHDQIAGQLNISVNTVKTQISRALEKLRSVIGKKISEHQKKIDSGLGFTSILFWLFHSQKKSKIQPPDLS